MVLYLTNKVSQLLMLSRYIIKAENYAHETV